MRRRRISAHGQWSVCAVLLALTAAATGCTSPPPDLTDPANRAEGSSTIVWVSSPTLRNASDDLRQVLVDAFEQAYPAIKVDLEPGPDNSDRLRNKLLSELKGGSPTPDVYSGDVIWPAEFGQAGLALPLNAYLPDGFWARFAAPGTPLADNTLIQAMSYQGNIYAVPYFVDYGFLFYRRDLLAEAGLKPPATWEQLLADQQTLKSHGLPYEFAWQAEAYEGLTCDWIELLTDAFGGPPPADPATSAAQSVAARLASPQALKALNFLRTEIDDGFATPLINSFEEWQGDAAFDSGKAAFLRNWDSSYANATSATSAVAAPGKVGVVPPPTFEGQHGVGFSVIGGWNLFVNPHSPNRQADLTFLNWMTGPQAQRIVATQFSEVPANYSVRTSPSVAASGNPVLAAAARVRPVARPSSTPDYQRITQAIYTWVNRALPAGPQAQAADPCSALLAAAESIDPAVHSALPCANSGSGS